MRHTPGLRLSPLGHLGTLYYSTQSFKKMLLLIPAFSKVGYSRAGGKVFIYYIASSYFSLHAIRSDL